ncbi:MAG: response regulator transcription factor [Vicinamibacteria bacterium]|nr:response regulator transcription factor [Vicinamibacteria bacterium]
MKKILVVDDDPDLRNAIRTVLETRYEITEAGGRDEAREVLKADRPDLIILDVMMDTTSTGFELAREFRKDKNLAQTRILMLTSVDSAANIDFKSAAGDPDWLPVDEYLSKPLQPKVLLQKVDNLLA